MSFFYKFVADASVNFVQKTMVSKNILPILPLVLVAVLLMVAPMEVYPQATGMEKGYVKGITTARAIGVIELLLGIASVVVAIRSRKHLSIKGARVALYLGVLAVVFSTVHFVTTAGAIFGSGSGKAGAILAFVLGAIGIMLVRKSSNRY